VKKISLSIAAGAVLAIAAVTASVAAELPSYEKAGLPISAVQVQAHQLSVLTPRHKVSTATASPGRETVGRAVR
jgi:hypothetical protein